MATVTLHYDGRNAAFKQLLDLFLTLGGKIEHHDSSFERSAADLKAGRVHEAKDGKDLIKQCLG